MEGNHLTFNLYVDAGTIADIQKALEIALTLVKVVSDQAIINQETYGFYDKHAFSLYNEDRAGLPVGDARAIITMELYRKEEQRISG